MGAGRGCVQGCRMTSMSRASTGAARDEESTYRLLSLQRPKLHGESSPSTIAHTQIATGRATDACPPIGRFADLRVLEAYLPSEGASAVRVSPVGDFTTSVTPGRLVFICGEAGSGRARVVRGFAPRPPWCDQDVSFRWSSSAVWARM